MAYIKNRNKRKKKLRRWLKRYFKRGLIVTFIALILWLLFHMFGDMQSTIVGLQDQVNQQNINIGQLQGQLQTSLETNTQLKVKINGLTEYIVDQNNVIHDLKEQINQPVKEFNPAQPKLGGGVQIEPENTPIKDTLKEVGPGMLLVPIIGALELGRRIIIPGGGLMGGF
jgi:regulator of replication initiation timing